jgi:hypothetical protein
MRELADDPRDDLSPAKGKVVRESFIQRQILDYLETLKPDGYFVKISQGRYTSTKGVADILGTYLGRTVDIEVKSATGRTSKFQDAFLSNVRRAGGYAIVARDVETVKALISRIRREVRSI